MEWFPGGFFPPFLFRQKKWGRPQAKCPRPVPVPPAGGESPAFCGFAAGDCWSIRCPVASGGPLSLLAQRKGRKKGPKGNLRRRSGEWLASPHTALFADSPGSSFSNRSVRFDLNRTFRRNPRALLLQQRCEPFRRIRTRAPSPLDSPAGVYGGRRTRVYGRRGTRDERRETRVYGRLGTIDERRGIGRRNGLPRRFAPRNDRASLRPPL